MGILFWYILRQYTKVFLLCMSTVLTVYLVVDFFEKVRKFLKHNPELPTMLAYFFYKIPEISFKLTPLAILMATILTLGVLIKNHEITAMRSCGLSSYQIAGPFIALGVVVTLILFSFAAVFIPLSNVRAEFIKVVLIEKKPKALTLTLNGLWLRIGQSDLLKIDSVEPNGQTLHRITLYRMRPEFQLDEIIEAKEAHFNQKEWLLSEAVHRKLDPNGPVTTNQYESLSLHLPLTPVDFQTWLSRTPENMTLRQLGSYIKRLQRDGHVTDKFLTNYWGRIAFSTVSLIMTILGLALSLLGAGNRNVAVSRGIGQALVIGFLFWAIHSVGIILGRNGAIMPVVGGWIASVTFLAVGCNLFLKVR